MRKLTSILCTAIAMSLAVLSNAPASAAPIFVPSGSANNGVIEVQTRAQIEEQQQPLYRLRRDRDFRQRGDYYYYHGHRGYRYKRPGYRYYNGWWFPAGAFIAGAIIGSAINNPPRYYHGGSAHVRWCYNRYRSYREWDNTFQPYHGPRRQCYSPYS